MEGEHFSFQGDFLPSKTCMASSPYNNRFNVYLSPIYSGTTEPVLTKFCERIWLVNPST